MFGSLGGSSVNSVLAFLSMQITLHPLLHLLCFFILSINGSPFSSPSTTNSVSHESITRKRSSTPMASLIEPSISPNSFESCLGLSNFPCSLGWVKSPSSLLWVDLGSSCSTCHCPLGIPPEPRKS